MASATFSMLSRSMMMMRAAPAAAAAGRCTTMVMAPKIKMAAASPFVKKAPQGMRTFSSMGGVFQSAKKFTPDHEYVTLPTPTTPLLTIGISSHAASALGDIVYLELPQPGLTLSQGDSLGTVESVKSASDILSPISGTVVEVNTYLLDHPGKLTSENAEVTEGAEEGEAGWLVRVQPAEGEDVQAELEGLMDGKAYAGFVKGLEEEH
ncbi:single hybrid motif-containing protein [Peziza echinospora]|nr:single hybrid motif-containing protein [Peziza echinospora]